MSKYGCMWYLVRPLVEERRVRRRRGLCWSPPAQSCRATSSFHQCQAELNVIYINMYTYIYIYILYISEPILEFENIWPFELIWRNGHSIKFYHVVIVSLQPFNKFIFLDSPTVNRLDMYMFFLTIDSFGKRFHNTNCLSDKCDSDNH